MKCNFNPECITISQMNLIFNVRIAWRRLTTWTRSYMISRYLGIGNAEDLFGSLIDEALSFSNMLQVVFGREIAGKNAEYLNAYALIFRDLITAQINGDTQAIQENINRFYQNINDNAAFLASINPYWNEQQWKDLLGTYFRYTVEEANFFAAGDYKQDIQTFDQITKLNNTMGDVFAQGLYEFITTGQQPSSSLPQVGEQCITEEQMNLIYDIRMFWFELATWVRNFMLSRYRGIGDANEVFNRLQQVPNDYVDNLRKFFGENPAIDELELELNTFIDLIDDLITAQLAGNTDAINNVTRLLYQNAGERAASVSKLNPYWNESEWRNRIYNNIRSTLAESVTFLTGDYARNLDIYSTLLDQAESTSGYFAQGLVKYLKSNPKVKKDNCV